MAWRHNPNYVMVCPIMIRIWQSGFIKPMSRRNERHAATCSNTRQPASGAASQFQQRTHSAPVITRDTQVRLRHSDLMKRNIMGAMTTSRVQPSPTTYPATKGRRSSAYQSASPEQRQAVREKMQTNPRSSSEERQRVSVFSPPRLSRPGGSRENAD